MLNLLGQASVNWSVIEALHRRDRITECRVYGPEGPIQLHFTALLLNSLEGETMKTLKRLQLLFILAILAFPTVSFSLDVGDKAPAFTAQSTHGEVALSDFAGKKNVVLALYFAAFTSVWSSELLDFQRDLEEFKSLDTEIIGVSSDDLETLEKFIHEEGVEFTLVADTDKKIKELYGSGRITYLIDKEGYVRFIQKGVPNNQDFLTQINSLK